MNKKVRKINKFNWIFILFLDLQNINSFQENVNNAILPPIKLNEKDITPKETTKKINKKSQEKAREKIIKKSHKQKYFFELSDEFFVDKSNEVSFDIILIFRKIDKRNNKWWKIFEIS